MTDSSAALAAALLGWLARAGVRDVVVAPGSRNAPLLLAAWAAAEAGDLRLHTRIDERTAAFLALGLCKGGSRAAVVTTSGTAVANLHPAALEAAHSGVPLVIVSADRPARLRGTGANQTTDQVGIFGPLVPSHDVSSVAELTVVPSDGLVHVNLQLDMPLMPTQPPSYLTKTSPKRTSHDDFVRYDDNPTDLPPGPRTVVVAGDESGPAARVLAEAGGWPLLAEPSSGARTGANAIRAYRPLLASRLGEEIERVVVFGHPTLSRPVSQLIERADVETLVVTGRGVWPTSPAGATAIANPRAAAVDDTDWLTRWQDADRAAGRSIDQLLAQQASLSPYDVAGAVARALPPGGLLVVGASSPIRDLDLMHRPTPVGERRKIVANRGLAGIDGTISTAIGAALGRPQGTRNLALMGDLTFLHDQNGLVIGPEEPRPDLTIVVANDDGGAIFSTLEQGDPAHAASFERLFGTPTRVDLAALCAATRTPHLTVTSRPELEQALANPNGGIEVIEAALSRADRRDLDARLRSAVATSVDACD